MSDRSRDHHRQDDNAHGDVQAASQDRDSLSLRQAYGLIEGITQGTEDMIAAEDSHFRYLYFNDAYRREFEKLWGRAIEAGTSMIEAMSEWPEEQQKRAICGSVPSTARPSASP